MDELRVNTLVYLPPEEIYDFLLDFPGYADYSSYLTEVRQSGSGGVGTAYRITVSWWKISYAARARVTDVQPPHRIDWRLTKDVDAHGHWAIEETPEEAPPDRDTASRVRLTMQYDPDSVSSGTLDLPGFVSLSWVVDRVTPLVREEAENVVEQIVADLEGESRPIELVVEEPPTR